jgi:homospermidine synthase
MPQSRQDWAQLAHQLEIKAIHIAEKDTQETAIIKQPFEFVNTWSVEGFVAEGGQPAELGWGTHEKTLPQDASQHSMGCLSAIYLTRPGLMARVRSWAPLAGSYIGFLITHNEAISIADYYSIKNDDNDQVAYRPTVHYSYLPSSDTQLSIHEWLGCNFDEPKTMRLLMHEIQNGMDELGVLLMGPRHQSYWYGSQLTIEEARRLAPYNNATTLQVAAGVLGGIMWALNHPNRGVVEADEMDFEEVLTIASPYLGTLTGQYSDWTPLKNREKLFKESLDHSDPWQFMNFLVA